MTAASPAPDGPRIAFLFIHDKTHQIPHCAPIIREVAASGAASQIGVFVRGAEAAELLRRLIPDELWPRIRLTPLAPPAWSVVAERLIGAAAPIRRIATIDAAAPLLKGYDAVVTPESTSARLKGRLDDGVRLIHTGHGAGDRDRGHGFRPDLRRFDHLLVHGEKYERRLLEAGVVQPGGYTVVGYPKFDAFDPLSPRRKLFGNDRPVVVYNPHFDPRLTSWFRHGEAVLDHFTRNPSMNLIFAPHVMLFGKRLHVTKDLRTIRWRRDVAARFSSAPNILIDPGSAASVDMTYMRAADIYLGDASSQVYEFLFEPRPVMFLNSGGFAWRDDPSFAHWRLGQVLDRPGALGPALGAAAARQDAFAPLQRAAFHDTFGDDPLHGGRRGAEAVLRVARAARSGRGT